MIVWRNHDLIDQLITQCDGPFANYVFLLIFNDKIDKTLTSGHEKIKILKIFNEDNLGFGGAINSASTILKQEKAEYLALLNPDIIINNDQLFKLYQSFQEFPDYGAFGPVLKEETKDGTYLSYGGRSPALHLNTRITDEQEKLDYIPGTVFFTKYSVLDKCDFLNDQYFFGGEIADLCKKITNHYQIGIIKHVCIRHLGHAVKSEEASITATYYNLRNRFLYIEEWRDDKKLTLKCNWIFKILRILVGAVIRLDLKKSFVLTKALKDGLHKNFGKQHQDN